MAAIDLPEPISPPRLSIPSIYVGLKVRGGSSYLFSLSINSTFHKRNFSPCVVKSALTDVGINFAANL
jgi:hypothetical protein